MSNSLIWMLVKDNNCFLKKFMKTKRAGAVQFSSEPGNLMNVNSFKYSGLANNQTIDISANKKTNDITMTLKVSVSINPMLENYG